MSILDEIYQDTFADEFLEGLEKEKQKNANNEQLLSDYERAFSSPHGKRVLDDIIGMGRIFHTTFTGNAWSNFHEGRRSLALYILHMSKRNRHLKGGNQ